MYNYTNYHFVKASSLSLANCANFMYMVWNVKKFLLGTLDILHPIFANYAPILHFPKLESLV
jgi:hypothetical protein